MISLLALVGAFVIGVFVGLGAGRIFCDYHHKSEFGECTKCGIPVLGEDRVCSACSYKR